MFSGFSNQVTSWIGAAKGEPQDEEVPAVPAAPPAAVGTEVTEQQEFSHDPSGAAASSAEGPDGVSIPLDGEDGEKKQSPTKAGGLFSGVKSSMTGWLGNASMPSMPAVNMPSMPAMPSMPSIPGLRKTQNAADSGEGVANEGLATSPDKEQQIEAGGGGERGDDEDRSRYISATEGADSGPESQAGTPTEEQAGQIGHVTAKVSQSAKTFGSFLYSAVNKAGAKIKKTVEDNHILGEFNKEQEAFAKSQGGSTDASQPPWVGHKNEASVKEEIMSLSSDRRNFVRAPPAGVDFQFNYDVSYAIALSIMTEDKALENMRFELVPKIITEENFWRNYFYRVSLICQAGDLGTLGDTSLMGSSEEAEGSQKKTTETVVEASSKVIEAKVEDDTNRKTENKVNDSEFISDAFQTTEKDLEEVQAGMRKLGIDTLAEQVADDEKSRQGTSDGQNDEQWEKDLEAELQDYEVVADGDNQNKDVNWEADVDDLLNEDADLK